MSDSFSPLLDCSSHFLVMAGGRGSGKSEFAGRKIFWRCMMEGNHNFLIMRKVRARCSESVVRLMHDILKENNITFDHNKTDLVTTFNSPEGKPSRLLFGGLDDPQKIKSIKGITGGWLEEATEFTKDDLMDIDLSIREPGPNYLQIMLSFNPDEALAPWLKDMFFDHTHPEAFVHVSTIDDNPIKEIREAYRKRLDAIDDETLKKIYRYGQWAALKGQIYNWDVVTLPADFVWDEVFYGGDFGFSVDPAAIVKIYRKADEYWLEEKLYKTGLTNNLLAESAYAVGVTSGDIMVFDSAEEKSIVELQNAGLTVLGADKGPGSVKVGIDKVKSKKIHIVEGSLNLINERRTYKWRQDGNGKDMPMPVDYNNHLLDAARYAITKMDQSSGGLGFAVIDY